MELVTFTLFLRRRVTDLPAIKIRSQVRSAHPALHPAVIIPTHITFYAFKYVPLIAVLNFMT